MRHKKKYEYNRDQVKYAILCQARGMDYSEGWAELIAEHVASACDAWIRNKNTVTQGDLDRIMCRELETFSPELAYALRENDTII